MTSEQTELFNDVLREVIAVTPRNIEPVKSAAKALENWLNENSILRESATYFEYSGYLQRVNRKIEECELINKRSL